MQELSPHLSRLKKIHKNDQKRLIEEQQKLFKEHGVSQASGCLTMIIQLPLLYGIYGMLNNIVNHSSSQVAYINSQVLPFIRIQNPIDFNFLGFSLAKSPSALLGGMGYVVLLIPVITGVLMLIQSKMMAASPVKEYKSDSPKEIKEKEDVADMTMQMQGQMLFLLPVLIGYASFNFSIGLSLYWNISTVFAIIQQYQVSGLGGLKEWIDKVYVRK